MLCSICSAIGNQNFQWAKMGKYGLWKLDMIQDILNGLYFSPSQSNFCLHQIKFKTQTNVCQPQWVSFKNLDFFIISSMPLMA